MQMPKFWYTSDTHFGHENIIKFSARPFDSVKHMNEVLVSNWNEVVKPEDYVYHLGDVAMGKFEESWKYVKLLNGNLYLVIGNHDRVAGRYHMSKKYVERFGPLYRERFLEIEYELFYSGLSGINLGLHHFPYEGDHVGEERYKEYRPKRKDSVQALLHGHVHEEWKVRGNQFNVGVDVRGYKPISRDELFAEVEAVLSAS
jgi:calcineurin-like phosphoesterase family protein